MYLLSRIKYLILLVFVSFISIINVDAVVKPTNNFYVNDYANILSSEVEEYILEKSVALNNVDGTQIVVVTVPNLDGMDLESYANTLFNEFGIGDREKNNGLLLLLALEEREFRVEVGYGLEGILPDGKTGRFQDDYIIPYLKNNDWDNGIKNGYDAFYSEIVKLNGLSVNYNEPIMSSSTSGNVDSLLSLYSFVPILFGMFMGGFLKTLRKNSLLYSILYIGIDLLLIIFVKNQIIKIFCIVNLFGFVFMRFELGGSGRYRSGFSGGSSRGGFSGGGFSSGGGRSGGGGSSRKF